MRAKKRVVGYVKTKLNAWYGINKYLQSILVYGIKFGVW